MEKVYKYTFDEFQKEIEKINLPKFIASQIFDWIYQKYVFEWSKMTNISDANKKILSEHFDISLLEVVEARVASDGTIKMLYKLDDENIIEMAIIDFEFGYSGCCSTQIGCNMGCKFCASGLVKKRRNLTTEEIVMEIVGANNHIIKNKLKKMGSLSYMGIGEPFDNIENVIKATKIVNDKHGINLGMRNFTLSTCGLINKLPLVAKELPQCNVAISLHAPTDEIRNKIMPVNSVYNIAQILTAAKEYIKTTKNDITFQYALIKDINDSNECAEQLSKLLNSIRCHVTLIEYNEVPEFEHFKATNNASNFKKILTKNNISFSTRLKRGREINAACGTMRSTHLKK